MARTYFQFILEYLTPQQKKEWSTFKMQKAARAHTDHFFGKGNNEIREPLMNHTPDKSEVHKAIEKHLNQTIPHEDYKAGVATDKYGRKTKIGKLVKDQNLQKQYASDNTRAGSKTGSQFTMSFHRGTQVAGQTNPAPNKEHPKGHSWENQSCKNIEDGMHAESLEHEIKHGTVVGFAHDHAGKEIYRATLQPYTRADKNKEVDDWENDAGYESDSKHPRVYHVDAEYGVKKPEFTAHAHDIARRLSAKAPVEENGKMLKYRVHHAVYDDKMRGETFHPDLNTSHIDKIVKSGSPQDKADIAEHQKLQPHHIEELEKQTRNEATWAKHHDIYSPHVPKGEEESPGLLRISRQGFAKNIRENLVKHPNTSADKLHHMMKNPYKVTVTGKKIKGYNFDEHEHNVMNEISNIENISEHGHNARKETLDYALKRSGEMRKSADANNNASLRDYVRTLHRYTLKNVLDHPNGGTEDHINHVLKHMEEGLNSKSSQERIGANGLAEHLGEHSKVRGDMLTRLINHKNSNVRSHASKNPNLTPEHVDQIFKNKDNQKNMPASSSEMHPIDRLLYHQHHLVTPEHIHIALKHPNHGVRVSALNHYKADLTHLEAAKRDKKNKQLVSSSISRELQKRVKAGTQDKHRDQELKLISGDGDDDEDAW